MRGKQLCGTGGSLGISFTLADAAQNVGAGDYIADSSLLFPSVLGTLSNLTTSWNAGSLGIGGSGTAVATFANGYAANIALTLLDANTVRVTGASLWHGTSPVWAWSGVLSAGRTSLLSDLADSHIFAGDDTILGNGFDNALQGWAGNDHIDGGAGSDTVVYTGLRSAYGLSLNADHTLSVSGAEGADTLVNVERIRFSEYTVNLTVGATDHSIPAASLKTLEELYVAFFNRVPDADGLAFWVNTLKGGASMDSIAQSFYDAGVQYSAQTGYSADMSNADLVRLVYKNVLGRSGPTAPQDQDVDFWAESLASGRATKGSLVIQMLGSAHTFKGNATWGWVADLLDNKVAVADYFAVQQGLNFNSGAVEHGMDIAAAITSTSTAEALALIGVADSGFGL
jgi:hypothetical protein